VEPRALARPVDTSPEPTAQTVTPFASISGPQHYTSSKDYCYLRLLDIIKPWPIGLIDGKLKGGVGIMLDDAVAGIYSF
jgi:phosphatidylglycerophosphatase A